MNEAVPPKMALARLKLNANPVKAHGGGERLGQVAGQGTVVGGQGGAHCQLNQQHGPELGGVEDEEGRNGEDDERHASADEHLLAAEFVGDVAHALNTMNT